ncbi:34050_t:CDS:2, partial [Gigaspora margarita]
MSDDPMQIILDEQIFNKNIQHIEGLKKQLTDLLGSLKTSDSFQELKLKLADSKNHALSSHEELCQHLSELQQCANQSFDSPTLNSQEFLQQQLKLLEQITTRFQKILEYELFRNTLNQLPESQQQLLHEALNPLQSTHKKIYQYSSNSDISTTYQNSETEKKDLEEKCKTLELEKQIVELTKTNESLKKEVKKHQFALGNATSFHQDSDSAGQLSKDISDLHNKLEKFCGLKKFADINEPEINKLLKIYDYSISGNMKANKNLISGLLERYVIETIIYRSNKYLECQDHDRDIDQDDQNLEKKIINATKKLLSLTKSISEYRSGTDAVSKTISTKLRQQIYGLLGNRGFSNKGNKEHHLIIKLRTEINNTMNSFRTIQKKEKLEENEAMTTDIIRQVINIFLFRLKVQEPVANWKFFGQNTSINTIMMSASLDDHDLDNLCVNVCAFPVIGSDLCEPDQEDENMKVIFPAQ